MLIAVQAIDVDGLSEALGISVRQSAAPATGGATVLRTTVLMQASAALRYRHNLWRRRMGRNTFEKWDPEGHRKRSKEEYESLLSRRPPSQPLLTNVEDPVPVVSTCGSLLQMAKVAQARFKQVLHRCSACGTRAER